MVNCLIIQKKCTLLVDMILLPINNSPCSFATYWGRQPYDHACEDWPVLWSEQNNLIQIKETVSLKIWIRNIGINGFWYFSIFQFEYPIIIFQLSGGLRCGKCYFSNISVIWLYYTIIPIACLEQKNVIFECFFELS